MNRWGEWHNDDEVAQMWPQDPDASSKTLQHHGQLLCYMLHASHQC